jgi:excinuclease UvrABC helicase subunit UvrB
LLPTIIFLIATNIEITTKKVSKQQAYKKVKYIKEAKIQKEVKDIKETSQMALK